MKTTLLSLLLLLPCAVRGQFILASNDLGASSSLCTDAHGKLLTAANGYATAGTFTITDAQIAAAAFVPGGAATLAAGFQPFGGSARAGESGFSGIFELDGVSAGQPDLPIFVVLHNRPSLAQSDEVFVYKSTATTVAGSEGITSVNIALTHDAGDGSVLIGSRSPFTATVPGYAENRPTLRLTMMQKLDYDGWVAQNLPGAFPSDTAQEADPDGDGQTNYQEWLNCTNPKEADSDKDGLRDGNETPEGARNADQDGDGVNDGDEVSLGTDPLDPFSHVSVAEKLADHWTLDDSEQDRLSCRRLQFSGAGTFTDSLDSSARGLDVPMELEAWQLPVRGHTFSFAFWFTPGSSDTTPPDGIVKMPGLWALTFPPGGGQIRLTGTSGPPLNAGQRLPDGLRHHIGLVLRPGLRAELFIDGLAAGSVPLGINTAGASLVFGAAGSPHYIDELLLWERAVGMLEMSSAASVEASSLYQLPVRSPMELLCFRRGLDSTTGAMQVELHWVPAVAAGPAEIRASADSITWNTLVTTAEASAILEFPAPGPARFFFQVHAAP